MAGTAFSEVDTMNGVAADAVTTAVRTTFFFDATATTEIYTPSLHDALLISTAVGTTAAAGTVTAGAGTTADGKTTRANNTQGETTYAAVCLKEEAGTTADWKTKRLSTSPSATTSAVPSSHILLLTHSLRTTAHTVTPLLHTPNSRP